MGRLKYSFRNIVFGMSYKIVRILMPFVIRTIIIYRVGTDYAGLDSLFTSILQTLSLVELGFGSALVFSMYKPIAEGDDELLCALLNYYKKLYRVIGTFIVIAGFALLPFLKYIIKGGYPADINIYILYTIYLLNTATSYFLFAHSQSLLNAFQRSDVVNKILLVVDLCMYIVQMLVLLLIGDYYLYVGLLLIGTFVVNILAKIISAQMYPQLKCNEELPKEQKKAITSNVKSLVGHKISGVVLNSTDNIVVSAFLGLTLVTMYSNYYYVISGVSAILSVCFEAVTASVGNSIVLESNDKNYKDYLLLSDVSDWIVGFCSVCLLCLYQPFMMIWTGAELLFPTTTMILFVVYFYFNMIRKMTLTYKDAAGMWWADFWKPYVGSISNIILNIIMINIIGINGVVLSSIISLAVISLPWGAWALHKHYFNKSLKKYYVKLSYHSLITIIACTIVYLVCQMIYINGFLGLIIKACVCVVAGNIIFLIGYLISHEIQDVLQFAKRFTSIFKKPLIDTKQQKRA